MRVDAEVAYVIELFCQPMKIANAVLVRIEKSLHVQLVDDRVLVPERIARDGGRGRCRVGI